MESCMLLHGRRKVQFKLWRRLRSSKAFEFHVKQGIVTGGEFETNQGCMPYQIKYCSHHMGDKGKYPNCKSYNETVVPVCVSECLNKGYKIPMNKDMHFGKRAYQVNVADLKKELVEKGPVTMSFNIYEDFFLYKTGAYHQVTGKKLGGHAVRVLGYGTENGESYTGWSPTPGILSGGTKDSSKLGVVLTIVTLKKIFKHRNQKFRGK